MNRKKILIVDDEPDVIKILRFSLLREGYEVVDASNGLDGLSKARQEKPDLIIMDVMMPKMNGYEVVRMLKYDAKHKHIPIIMLTARTQENDKRLGLTTGADEYIFKPFELKELLAKIDEMVKHDIAGNNMVGHNKVVNNVG
jgi:DNA-binding response OmpR family regulator